LTFLDFLANQWPMEIPQERVSFYDFSMSDLTDWLQGQGKEKFRAQQMFKWVYGSRVQNFEGMLNLSKDFRTEMAEKMNFELPKLVNHRVSVDGTQKFLFDIGDNKTIETVLIPSEGRLTLCVSSEVGCNMACKFCYTGKQKLKRRLKASEIVGQFVLVEDILRPQDLKISNIVFMGMGEPLDNPEAVFKAIKILHEPFGRNLSRRKVTVSTSGLVPEMHRITESGSRLAVSLNGYDDASRTSIMPINQKYPLKDLLKACQDYCRNTGDKVTFEYVLLKGITDQLDHARKLASLVRPVPCKVNIIPFNEHPGSGFERPSDETINAFHQELMDLGVHVLLRRTMGRDIYAACGQLTSEFDNKPLQMDISNSKLSRTNHLRL